MIIFPRKVMIISLDRIDDPTKAAESIGTKVIMTGTEIVIINQEIIQAETIPAENIQVETILGIIPVETIQEIIQAEITQEGTIKVEIMEAETILLVIMEVEIIIVGTNLLQANPTTCKTTVTMIRNRQCIYDSSFNGQLQCKRNVSFCSRCVWFNSAKCPCY
jgi:hypothetical protein